MENDETYFFRTWTIGGVDFHRQPTGMRDGIRPSDTLTFRSADKGTRIVCDPNIKDPQSQARWAATGFVYNKFENSLFGVILCGTQPYMVEIASRKPDRVECFYYAHHHAPAADEGKPRLLHDGTWHGDTQP